MTFLAYLHTFVHPFFLLIWNIFWEITKHSGPLFQWQTIIGSFLGACLPLWFYFWRRNSERKEKEEEDSREKDRKIEEDRKEAFRRVEISCSLALHHIYTSIEQLEDFVSRIRSIISSIEEIDDETTYCLNETNFPPIINIYFDIELTKMKFKSYYLHNKILGIEYIIRWANSSMQQFRDDYEKLIRKNELMVNISLSKTIPTKTQRNDYANNLKWFIQMVEKVLSNLKRENIKSIFQAKVYNLKLMNDFNATKEKFENGKNEIEIIDLVNSMLEAEVQKMKTEAERKESIL
jgi:hypothetical protein